MRKLSSLVDYTQYGQFVFEVRDVNDQVVYRSPRYQPRAER
jgi:hypothetical protein